MPRRSDIFPVETRLRVIEAYLPDAGRRDDDWYQKLLDRTSQSLAPYGLVVDLLVLPEDETALWLIGASGSETVWAWRPVELDLPGVIAAAMAVAGGRVMERQMDARLVRPDVPGR